MSHPVQVALCNSISALHAFEQDFRAHIAQRAQHEDFNEMRDSIDLGLKIQAAHAEVERIHADISLLLEKSDPIFVQNFAKASEPVSVAITPNESEPVSVPVVKEKSESEAINTDLVSRSASEKCAQEKIGRNYIAPHLNADKKKDLLEEAAKQLGLKILQNRSKRWGSKM